MSPRRSKLEVRLTVLRAVNQGLDKPTHIMYASNMSWEPVQKILSTLVKQGLLELVQHPSPKKRKRRYYITEKGTKTLDYFGSEEYRLLV